MMTPSHSTASISPTLQDRQVWLAVLARASVQELEQAWLGLSQAPDYQLLRAPETGLTQVRARAGGTGQQFNLGEATVSRCTVQLDSGEIGVGYVMGRNGHHAEWVAVFDALLQHPTQGPPLQRTLIDSLAQRQAHHKQQQANATAATKVDFFTMVRGDD